MEKTSYSFQDCYAVLENGSLRIGNAVVERSWRMEGEIPAVCSLKNKKTGKEWLDCGKDADWLCARKEKDAFFHEDFLSGKPRSLRMEAGSDDDCGIGREHLKAAVVLEYADCQLRWIHRIYPQTAVLRSCLQVVWKDGLGTKEQEEQCALTEENPGEKREMLPAAGTQFYAPEPQGDYQDAFPLAPLHCKWKSVSFVDRTDDYDNLVHTDHGIFNRRESRYINGNLLFAEDPLDKEGLIFIKEGPTPLAYQGNVKTDFYVKGNSVFPVGWGFDRTECSRAGILTAYGSSVVFWDGERGNASLALQDYHRALHSFSEQKDAFVMSNTWGDQSCDGRLSEQFLLEELEQAGRLGITLYQIDDGWQNGTSANSVNPGGVWNGYYAANADFWEVNPLRFPNGLEPVAAFAKSKGVRLGLWFSPDSSHEFANWKKDSETLIGLHRRYGIAAFKMDGVKLTSKVSEENLTKLIQQVLTETDGNVFFNMDVTAETRSGYYGRIHYGSLFVENRFTGNFGKWPNYYPHRTLRNLWMLSEYMPASRLQMEFLNVARNQELYEGDPLAPAVCGMEYSFAVTMCANPLAWMELTGLNEAEARVLERILPQYRQVQSDLLSGYVLPIGEEPDGTAWTGFQSVKTEDKGYLLLIRENSSEETHRCQLRGLADCRLKLEGLLGDAGQRSVQVDGEGRAAFTLPGAFCYALYRYQVEKNEE
ncbi:alpha-galactosidase [Eisenbergiella massiliensis]|uniref:alpha-galactosidase n=1 Tax=Eisenbergiella massiliensis TaxID=1720294 RepID=UPI0039928D33